MRLFVFYNRYERWHEKFPHSSWLFVNNLCVTCKDLFFSTRRFTSKHAFSKHGHLKSRFYAMINIWFLQNHTFICFKFHSRFFNSVEGMSRREDCLVSTVSKHVVFTSWFHSVINFCIWSCHNVYILLLVSIGLHLQSGYCSLFKELIVFSKLKSSMHNRECPLRRISRESSMENRVSILDLILNPQFSWGSRRS